MVGLATAGREGPVGVGGGRAVGTGEFWEVLGAMTFLSTLR